MKKSEHLKIFTFILLAGNPIATFTLRKKLILSFQRRKSLAFFEVEQRKNTENTDNNLSICGGKN